ncbi:putative 7-carboxy-7-deazaguanine synthase QueE [Clostridium sp. Marseille-P2415]|uniref:putative 7-carboxy-7-deazaguanine synthase QueE n=1 Tax=Clostridium sp. Marseille-P2415 TaxID=1805471 RepID=UPI0009883E39|nr:putative 7-carboxy-7-deazaguanine synthase QueE [Clostridium sp. Marseille-P2415]
MTRYKVVEKFVSINGEGVLAGQLAVFIRFKGCNLSCSYCDTAWANEKQADFVFMTGLQIYRYIKETGIKNVTLTGGEPLLQPDIRDLLSMLSGDKDLHIEIETNGSIGLSDFINFKNPPSFTMDYKLPGSFMESEMLISNLKLLTKKDTVKFVAGSTEDLNRAKEIMTAHELTKKCHVHISTVFGKLGLKEVVEYMKQNGMNDVTLQLQMHKIIWGPGETGV